MAIEQLDRQSLIDAIAQGRQDFSGIIVVQRPKTPSEAELGVILSIPPNVTSLNFDGADLGRRFSIEGWRNSSARLSMRNTTGGEVVLREMFIDSFIASLTASVRGPECWLELRHFASREVSLIQSFFNNGFHIKESIVLSLDLTRVKSNRSYFDERRCGSVMTFEAELGERSAPTLGELLPGNMSL